MKSSTRTICFALSIGFLASLAPGAAASCTDLAERCTYPDSGSTGQDDTVLGPVSECETPPSSGPTGGLYWDALWTADAYSSITCNYADDEEDGVVDLGGELAWDVGQAAPALVASPTNPVPVAIATGGRVVSTALTSEVQYLATTRTWNYLDDMWIGTCYALYNDPNCI